MPGIDERTRNTPSYGIVPRASDAIQILPGLTGTTPLRPCVLETGMGDTAGETIACQYCGTDIQVSAGRSRYEASIAHFEAEHIQRPGAPHESGERTGADVRAAPPVEGDEHGISD